MIILKRFSHYDDYLCKLTSGSGKIYFAWVYDFMGLRKPITSYSYVSHFISDRYEFDGYRFNLQDLSIKEFNYFDRAFNW